MASLTVTDKQLHWVMLCLTNLGVVWGEGLKHPLHHMQHVSQHMAQGWYEVPQLCLHSCSIIHIRHTWATHVSLQEQQNFQSA
jgi:hypothetical protein